MGLKFNCCLLCALLMGPSALAQHTDLSEKSLEELMNITVTTASKHEQLATEAPASVTVITREEIKKYGYRTLGDVLRSVRGFYVTYDRNYTYLGVRGFGPPGDYNTRILLLIDGHRMNENIYDSLMAGTEFQLDVDLIQRIEVIRGPASSLYGSNALFGVINLITRRGGEVKGVETSLNAGSFGTFAGRATYGENFGGIDLLVSGTINDSRGHGNLFFPEFNFPETNNGMAVRADDDRFTDWFGTVSWQGWKLQGLYTYREKGIPTASFGTVFNDRRNRTMDGRRYIDLSYEHTFNGKWQFSARGYYDNSRYDGAYIFAANSLGEPARTLNIDAARGQWWGGELKLSRQVLRKHRFTAGGEFRSNLEQWQANYDVVPFYSYLDDHRSSRDWGAYLQDEFSIRRDLILNAGIRFDRYGRFDGTVNPRLALIYQRSANTTAKLLYGTAFRVPNTFEMYYYAPDYSNNPWGLKPEKIRSTEAVVERRFARHFAISVSGYYNWIKDMVAEQPDPVTGNVMYRNLDDISGRGLEFEVSGKLHGGWEGRASYALQETMHDRSAQPLTNSPKHLGKLNLSIPLVKDDIFAGVEGQYTSRRRTVHDTWVGGFPIVNVTLFSSRLLKPFEISGSLYNVFDKRYADPVSDSLVEDAIAQDGRNFRVKLTWHWGQR